MGQPGRAAEAAGPALGQWDQSPGLLPCSMWPAWRLPGVALQQSGPRSCRACRRMACCQGLPGRSRQRRRPSLLHTIGIVVAVNLLGAGSRRGTSTKRRWCNSSTRCSSRSPTPAHDRCTGSLTGLALTLQGRHVMWELRCY